MMSEPLRFSRQPALENPSLIVGWQEDAGKLSPEVIGYLNEKIKGENFCEIEPAGFFSFAGVSVKNDIAQFPRNVFYAGEKNDLVIFKGSEPSFERFRFLNAILDVAQRYCKVKELFTVSGTIASLAHTSVRKIWAVFNQPEFQTRLSGWGLEDMNWQGPPALNSYLLWAAQKRGIPALSLWPEIPFYLAAGKDLQAVKLVLAFLDKKFDLNLDLRNLDEKIREQNTKIDRLREEKIDVNRSIAMLEGNLSLSEEEQIELAREVTKFLES